MAPLTLLCLCTLALSAGAEGTYGRGYGYAAPRRRVLVKAVPVKRIVPYVRKGSTVYRGRHDSYDEADAVRTADHDVNHRLHQQTVYTPPYAPAVVEKTVHVPLQTGHVAHDVAHVVHEHVPYHYDYHVVPACALANQAAYNITVCLDDTDYPTDTIIHALKSDPILTDKLMSDVTYQSADNLVDGLTKAEEEHYTRKHYFGVVPHDAHHVPLTGYAYSDAYQREGGYICPSDIFYARVKRAVNTFGEWKVVVNLPDPFKHDPKYKKYVQTSRLESCVSGGSPCSFVDHLFPSACLQKYTFARLVAWDHKQGLHVDSFKLPSACSCHLAPKPGVLHV